MTRTRIALMAALSLAAGTALADTKSSVSTAAQAFQAKEDVAVTLEGTISRHLGGERYELQDNSGAIVVEIDDGKWPTKQSALGARVRVHGEVERKALRRTVEVEAEQIEVLP